MAKFNTRIFSVFLEKLGKEHLSHSLRKTFWSLTMFFKDETVSECFRGNLIRLLDSGVIEQISRDAVPATSYLASFMNL